MLRRTVHLFCGLRVYVHSAGLTSRSALERGVKLLLAVQLFPEWNTFFHRIFMIRVWGCFP